MNTVGLTLTLVFLLCGEASCWASIVPERRVPALLAWFGSLAALSALWARRYCARFRGRFHCQLCGRFLPLGLSRSLLIVCLPFSWFSRPSWSWPALSFPPAT